jgi:hypothetical protein
MSINRIRPEQKRWPARSVKYMRTLGYALILFGIISAVIILIYSATIGWSGLTGSVVAIMTGIGFLNIAGECDCSFKRDNCCNRY